VDWTGYNGTVHHTPLNINCHCFNPATTVVLNPAAFENVPNGQFGAKSKLDSRVPGHALTCGERQLQP
jgi:hypothetical protein